MDVLAELKAGNAQVEWDEVLSEHEGHKLYIRVIRDGMKVGGVRVAASAKVLQQIADLLDSILLTPRVIDLIWQQAQVRFDPVINEKGVIVANMTSEHYSTLVDAEVEKKGGDQGGLIDSIGKYWVLSNRLAQAGLEFGKANACNYGWLSSTGQYRAITPGLKLWQEPGYRHNDDHVDPSQLVRLMARGARLIRAGGDGEEQVDLVDVVGDPALAPLVNHDGVLRYLRMANVPPLEEPFDRPQLLAYDGTPQGARQVAEAVS